MEIHNNSKRRTQRRGSAVTKTMINRHGGGGRWQWRQPLLISSSSPPLSCRLLVTVALLILPPPPPSFAAETDAPDDGYSCRAERAAYPCRAYAFYRAALPDLLDLAAVGDLFSVSRAMIANASGFPSTSAVGRPLPPGQPLLVPLTCSCSEVAAAGGNRSYALLPYQIRAGDTFYIVSTLALQNLTTWRAVVLANPSLVPTQLQVGVVALFPVFCQCPPPPLPQRGSVAGSYFVTYVSQPSDTRSSIASLFGVDPRSLVAPNGTAGELDPFTAVLVPVSRLPVLQLQTGQHPLPPPPSSCQSERDNKRGAVVGLGFGMGFLGLMLLAAMLWWGWKEKEKKSKKERGAGKQQMMAVSGGGDLMAEIVECLDRYRVFEVEELREATAGFDEGCRVGGSVYRGCIQGETYAVKKLRWDARQQLKILQKVNHTNLVKLEGFSVDPENAACYLVYEFVENGSLRSWLRGGRSNGKLDWRTRLRIALDVANGLQYIHEHTWPRLVAHRDIKASNILLDNQMRAKISDFGLTRSGSNAMTTRFVGSPGYVAPEYIEGGLVSTKMDVFSYGVVLLELVSGREAVNKEGEALWVEVERALQGYEDRRDGEEQQQLQEWVDEELVKLHVPMDGVINVMAIARACLRRDPSRRPSMVDVAYNLSKTDDLYVDFSGDGLPIADTSVVAR